MEAVIQLDPELLKMQQVFSRDNRNSWFQQKHTTDRHTHPPRISYIIQRWYIDINIDIYVYCEFGLYFISIITKYYMLNSFREPENIWISTRVKYRLISGNIKLLFLNSHLTLLYIRAFYMSTMLHNNRLLLCVASETVSHVLNPATSKSLKH